MKEKIDNCQVSQTLQLYFMKVGDVHNSNRKTVSFNTHNLIWEQLDNLTSMEYNMSIQRKEITGHLSLRYIKREGKARTDKIFRDRCRNRSSNRDRGN